MNILLILILFNLSCKNTDDHMRCLKDKNQEWQKLEIYKNVQTQLGNTLKEWIDNNIKGVKRFKVTNWKIDETIFFNSKLDGALLLILRQDTAIEAKMDFIDMIYAKKEGDKWKFFYKSLPSLHSERYYTDKKDPTTPYTFEELSNIAKKKIIEGGYFKKGNCEINDRYINDWYNETLEKKHQEFLNNQ